MIDLQDVLAPICHVSHAYRGQVQVLQNLREQGEVGFLACIDVPDSQMTNMNPIDATQPLLASIWLSCNTLAPPASLPIQSHACVCRRLPTPER